MNGDLKNTFVLRETRRYIQECEDACKILIARYNIGETNELVDSFRTQARTAGSGAVGELIFKEYGRMVDMGAGRGHPLGGLRSTAIALNSKSKIGLAYTKDNTRKAKKFYSKVVYGKLTYLQNRLLYGYTEETIAMLKKEMNSK